LETSTGAAVLGVEKIATFTASFREHHNPNRPKDGFSQIASAEIGSFSYLRHDLFVYHRFAYGCLETTPTFV
jgi:hypothetical protein